MKLARLGAGPEIFYSVQGEGPQLGAPSVFVRLSRCNLYCSWCDTPYTWNWRGAGFSHDKPTTYDRQEATLHRSVEDVARDISQHDCSRVILTGGEPLLQQRDLEQLMAHLRELNPAFVFEVETNGTRVPTAQLDADISLYVVSPKLSNSGVLESLRLADDALSFFAASAKSCFKFVVSSARDMDEVLALCKRYQVAHERVFLMPMGTTPQQLDEHSPLLVQACLQHGFRFSDRLHIRLFGNQPGV